MNSKNGKFISQRASKLVISFPDRSISFKLLNSILAIHLIFSSFNFLSLKNNYSFSLSILTSFSFKNVLIPFSEISKS